MLSTIKQALRQSENQQNMLGMTETSRFIEVSTLFICHCLFEMHFSPTFSSFYSMITGSDIGNNINCFLHILK